MIRASFLACAALTLVAQAPAPSAPSDPVIARIGSREIRQSELDTAIAALPAQQQQQLLLVEGARERYVEQYLEMTLLAAKAERDGLHRTPDFQKKVESARNQLLATELLHRDGADLQARMELKDEDVKAYYEAHKAKFMTTGKFTVRHILVGVQSERNPSGLPEDQAKARLAQAQAALKAGRKLEDLTKEFSDDPGSKDQGGLYKDIPFGQFVPEFEKAVREQELGQPGEAVRSAFGYHIIQVESREMPTQQTFEAAQDKVRQAAGQARQEEVWSAYIAQLKGEIPFKTGADLAAAPSAPAKGGKGAKPAKSAKTPKGGAQ